MSILVGRHAAQTDREARGYRWLWPGIRPTTVPDVFRDLTARPAFAVLGMRLAAANGGWLLKGRKGFFTVPFDCRIGRMVLVADRVGSMVVDIYRSDLAHFPPGPTQSICTGNARPSLVNAQSTINEALFGWTTQLEAGDEIGFEVLSASGIGMATLSLFVTQS